MLVSISLLQEILLKLKILAVRDKSRAREYRWVLLCRADACEKKSVKMLCGVDTTKKTYSSSWFCLPVKQQTSFNKTSFLEFLTILTDHLGAVWELLDKARYQVKPIYKNCVSLNCVIGNLFKKLTSFLIADATVRKCRCAVLAVSSSTKTQTIRPRTFSVKNNLC